MDGIKKLDADPFLDLIQSVVKEHKGKGEIVNREGLLLAFKPAWFDEKTLEFSPYNLPDYTWRLNRIQKFTCRQGHAAPDENCGCGIQSTLNRGGVIDFFGGLTDPSYPAILTVVQVLGEVVIDRDFNLRSSGIYLWGMVKPRWMNLYPYEQLQLKLYEKYLRDHPYQLRPHYFTTLNDADRFVGRKLYDYVCLRRQTRQSISSLGSHYYYEREDQRTKHTGSW